MKVSHALEQFERGNLHNIDVELRRNPNNIEQWFVMLRYPDGKTLMLVDDNDRCVVDGDLDHLVQLLKNIGFHEAMIAF